MATPTEQPTIPLHLTSRDYEIVKAVFDHRILTSDLIQRLIPGSNQQLLRRLQKLTAHRYLTRHSRTSAHIPYAYQVGPRAGEVMVDEYGIDLDRVKRRAKKIRAEEVKHALMIARLQFAVTQAVAQRSNVELDECVIEDELPSRGVTYQDGSRMVKASFKNDLFIGLKYQGRYLAFRIEADRSTERGKVAEAKIKALYHFWLQEREKARRGEKAFYPFRVLWAVPSQARLESLRQHSMVLNDGKGTAVHWFTTEASYYPNTADTVSYDPQKFFGPIWRIGRTGDDAQHHLLETREQG